MSTVYSKHVCRRVSLSGLYVYGDSNFGVFRFPYDYVNAHKWLDPQISIVFVYEDSNFGGLRIPNVYIYAHKWLEHQLLGQLLPVSNFPVCYQTLLYRNFYQKWTFLAHLSSVSR